MTEFGFATLNPIDGSGKLGAVGLLTPGFRAMIRNDQGEELGVDQEGQLWIQSLSNMAGYWQNPDATQETIVYGWLNTGDVMRVDKDNFFWFCGRKAHRVRTANGVMFTVPCETIFNQHPSVYRSALVGIGPKDQQRPVIIVELWPEKKPADEQGQRDLVQELLALAAKHPLTQPIQEVLIHPSLPVDIRHNSKIFREQLTVWAAEQGV